MIYEIVLAVGIVCLIFVAGFILGKSVTGMRYAEKLDKKNKTIDKREEQINELYEKLRKVHKEC